MKTRTLISVQILIIILVVAVPVLFAGGSKKEELHGTWINEEYKGNTPPFEKHVITPDGTMQFFKTEVAPWEPDIEVLEGGWMPCDSHAYTIEDKWVDSDGNDWYKGEAQVGGYEKIAPTAYLLMKISDSNRVLEYMVGRIDYHEELDPTAVKYTYRIYYRQ